MGQRLARQLFFVAFGCSLQRGGFFQHLGRGLGVAQQQVFDVGVGGFSSALR